MKRADFSRRASGRLVKTLQGNLAFVPHPLPAEVSWDSTLVKALTDAVAAMARLSQASKGTHSPYLVRGLSNVLATREAQLSSRIEAIYTSATNLFMYQEGMLPEEESDSASAVAEAHNYLEALHEGLKQLRDKRGLPLSNRLICRLHAIMMRGVRGANKRPGEFRQEQNFIGTSTRRSEADAIYVPPPPDEMQKAMQALEQFIHSPDAGALHPFLVAGMVHYQFEAIHPFLDGNGRTGRLLIMLLLCAELGLDEPLIYPSAYFESHRQEYYGLLLAVSTHGEWMAWLLFFLEGMRTQCVQALQRFEAMDSLQREYTQLLEHTKSAAKLKEVLSLLFTRPVLSSAWLSERMQINPATGHRYVHQLLDLGILQPLDERRRGRIFVAQAILDIVEGENGAEGE